jgi:uncharacterized MAPEG superfamily protein
MAIAVRAAQPRMMPPPSESARPIRGRKEGEEIMPDLFGGSVELQTVYCAIALGIVQLVLAILASIGGRGMAWATGARDEGWPQLGKFGGRLERAYKNLIETLPFFIGAALLVHALGKSTPTSVLGAEIYLWARVLYVPAYVIAIPFVRTLVWGASLVGILMVMAAIWPGM